MFVLCLLISLYLCNHCGNSGTLNSRIQGISISGFGTREEAYRNCSSGMALLPAPGQIGDTKSIGALMTLKDTKSIWLAFVKVRNGTFRWLSGKLLGEEFMRDAWNADMNCGILNLRDASIEAARCSRTALGFVCESKDANGCMMTDVKKCIEMNGKSLIFFCGAYNWFDARETCNNMGLQLASVHSDEKDLKILSNSWYQKGIGLCNEAWIGFRREEWIYAIENKTSTVIESSWGKGEPSNKGTCAVLSKRAGNTDYRWFAEDCKAVHSWWCYSSEPRATTSLESSSYEYKFVSTPTNSEPPARKDKNLLIITATSITIGVGILLACMTFIILWRKRANKRKNALSSNDPDTNGTGEIALSENKHHSEEEEGLLNNNGDSSKNQEERKLENTPEHNEIRTKPDDDDKTSEGRLKPPPRPSKPPKKEGLNKSQAKVDEVKRKESETKPKRPPPPKHPTGGKEKIETTSKKH